MVKCTMPKCRAVIKGWTGLQEINATIKHFEKKHGIILNLEGANRAIDCMEAGVAPVRIDEGNKCQT